MADYVERLKRWVYNCAANTELQDLRDALERGEQSMHFAEGWSDFTRQEPAVTQKFAQAREGLSQVKSVLDAAQNMCLDLRAIGKIHSAIQTLNQDGMVQRNPAAAAKAFGQLFVGFGRLAHKLPSPAKEYATILENCGDFFENLRRGLDPGNRKVLRDLKYNGMDR